MVMPTRKAQCDPAAWPPLWMCPNNYVKTVIRRYVTKLACVMTVNTKLGLWNDDYTATPVVLFSNVGYHVYRSAVRPCRLTS